MSGRLNKTQVDSADRVAKWLSDERSIPGSLVTDYEARSNSSLKNAFDNRNNHLALDKPSDYTTDTGQIRHTRTGRGSVQDEEAQNSVDSLTELSRQSTVARLRDQIQGLRCCNVDGQYFVPEGTLDSVLTSDAIPLALQASRMNTYLVDKLAESIEKGARKTFAILIVTYQSHRIRDFVELNIFGREAIDSMLPLEKNILQSHLGNTEANAFFDVQWEHVAPIFGEGLEHHFLGDRTILPLVEKSFIAEGRLSSVYSVVIHPGHCKFAGSVMDGPLLQGQHQESQHPEIKVALKMWKPQAHGPAKEVDNLRLIQSIGHPNIIRLLGSYDHQDSVNLLFPYLGGDLCTFLYTVDNERSSSHFCTEPDLLYGLCGIASAIETLHFELMVAHLNITPDNILIMDNEFVLADFTAAQRVDRYVPEDESIPSPFTTPGRVYSVYEGRVYSVYGTRVYRSPEYERVPDDEQVSRPGQASDIWSFGCIIAEVATYMLAGGAAGVLRFWESRKFTANRISTSLFHVSGDTNPRVTEWFDRLRENGSQSSTDLINLVEAMLRIKPSDRPDARTVHRRLRCLTLKSKAQAIKAILKQCTEKYASPECREQCNQARETTEYLIEKAEQFVDENAKAQSNLEFGSNSRFGGLMLNLDTVERWVQYAIPRSFVDAPDMVAMTLNQLRHANKILVDLVLPILPMSVNDATRSSSLDTLVQRSQVDHGPSDMQSVRSSISPFLNSVYAEDEKTSTLLSSFDKESSGQSNTPPKKPSLDANTHLVKSDKDNFWPLISIADSSRILLAEKRLAVLLADSDALSPLIDEVLSKMGKDRFLNNFRRLLKRYFFDLVPHAKGFVEKTTIDLLRNRRSRVKLARLVADMRGPEKDELRVQYHYEVHNHLKHLENRILNNAGATTVSRSRLRIRTFPEPPWSDEGEIGYSDDISGASGTSDAGSEDESHTTNSLLKLPDMETLFTRSQAFQNLVVNLRVLLFPADIRIMLQNLAAIPSDGILFSTDDDRSLSNRIKIIAEHLTDDDWNWWPLRPKMRLLKDDEERVLWTCHCGTRLWCEMSKTNADIVRLLLQSRGSVARAKSLCRMQGARTRGIGSSIMKAIKRTTEASRSSNNQRPWYYALELRRSPSRKDQSANTGQNNTLTSSIDPATNQRQGNQLSIAMPQILEKHVIFGVEGPRLTLEVDEIKVSPSHEDHDLIQDIRREHRNLRGWLRYWFSLWQLQHCDFVKFKRTLGDRILFHEEDLPEDPTYDYRPRPPDALCPPITPHEFALALRACGDRCRSFSPFHDCIRPLRGDAWLQKIPKWKAQSGWRQAGPEYGWGLQARHVISFAYLIFYHVLIFAGTFGFWAWYEIRHPDELQNAAVPLTTVAVLLSLFWSASGILKIFREPG